MKTGQTNRSAGFNRSDLLMVICVVMVLGVLSYPVFLHMRKARHESACIVNLRMIDGIKMQWALENHAEAWEIPSTVFSPSLWSRGSAVRYCENEGLGPPYCPDDPLKRFTNSYSPNCVTNLPTCKIVPDRHFLVFDPNRKYVRNTNDPADELKNLPHYRKP